MKPMLRAALLFVASLLIGCPSRSSRDITTFAEEDYLKMRSIVEELRSDIPEVQRDDLDPTYLIGEKIPEKLRYLEPQAVCIGRNHAQIFLYKSPAGQEAFYISFDKSGGCIIELHAGSWSNSPSVVWTSTQPPIQPVQQTSAGARR